MTRFRIRCVRTAMDQDEEPLRIPVSDVFDLHTVQPKEVGAGVEAYIEEANLCVVKIGLTRKISDL
jgi:hypothetical protein